MTRFSDIIWIAEGFALNEAGHLILTSYVDLRKPEDRTCITGLVRGIEREYALEDCETLIVSKPARYRSFGEKLIRDAQEGLAVEEAFETSEGTLAEIAKQRAVSDLNEATEIADPNVRSLYASSELRTVRRKESIAFGSEWWIFSTSIRPGNDQWASWRNTLPDSYDHVSEIGQPAKFAEALARMVAEQIGPQAEDGEFFNTFRGVETVRSKHPAQWVIHGPVSYVDSVYDSLNAIDDPEIKAAAFMFTKSKDHADQREYRFAVMNRGSNVERVTLRISGMMRDALGRTDQTLIRESPIPNVVGETTESVQPGTEKQSSRVFPRKSTTTEKSIQKVEWGSETRGSDGQVVSSERDEKETVTERTTTHIQEIDSDEVQRLSLGERTSIGQDEQKSAGLTKQSREENDVNVSKQLAMDEFDWEDRGSDEDAPATSIRTVTGRVYKSFSEMVNDPTCPTRPFDNVSHDDAITSQEIVQTYRAIEVVATKMKDIKKEFRQDVASAGWYAMLCIRNIYAEFGDIVDTLSIERERFIVIRLKNNENPDAKGRIVIAPTGAFAYSIQMPNKKQLGQGGLDWGTRFFPIGIAIDTFDSFGWAKKVI